MKGRRRFALMSVFMGACLIITVFPSAAHMQAAPTTLLAKTWLAQRGKQSGLFKLTSFRKTNGIKHDAETYTMEFEAVVICLDTTILTSCDKPPCTSKDQTVKYSDRITFEKTERGWRFHHCGDS